MVSDEAALMANRKKFKHSKRLLAMVHARPTREELKKIADSFVRFMAERGIGDKAKERRDG